MDDYFSELHHKEIGDDPAASGWPDDGNGRYMQLKSYPEWYFMNIAKRQKSNGLESIVTMAPLSMINGLFLPYPTCAFMATHTFGRYLYNLGYVEKEGAMN